MERQNRGAKPCQIKHLQLGHHYQTGQDLQALLAKSVQNKDKQGLSPAML